MLPIKKFFLKKLIPLVSLLFFSATVKAQYNYAPFGVGGGFSIVRPFSDLAQNNTNHSFNIDLYYNYSPYVPFALEVQKGTLSGGNDVTDPSHRYFVNSFTSISAHGDLQFGEIIDYEDNFIKNALKGFYVGLGIGATLNNITSIRRYALDVPTYKFPGEDHSVNMLLPLRFGYEIKFFDYNDEPSFSINLGYVHNLTFSEGLDGYNDPPTQFKNNVQDMFSQITFNVKFFFGNPLSYTKPIRQNRF